MGSPGIAPSKCRLPLGTHRNAKPILEGAAPVSCPNTGPHLSRVHPGVQPVSQAGVKTQGILGKGSNGSHWQTQEAAQQQACICPKGTGRAWH